MKPNADVTVYSRQGSGQQETFVPHAFYNVTWKSKHKNVLTEQGLMGVDEISIRIPEASMVGFQGTFQPGDWAVRGIVDDPLEVATKNNPNACMVKTVADNRDSRVSGDMQHWRLIG